MSSARSQPSADVGPHSPRSPQIGDWVITSGPYSFDVHGPIVAITAAQIRYQWFSRERRRDLSRVVFAGDEKACRDLYSVLEASKRKRFAEEREAGERHRERTQAAIAKATEAARATGSRVVPQVEGEGSREEP